MKKNVLLPFFFVLVSTCIAQPLRILWIGNSYTAFNNLPSMFSNLAASAGYEVIVDSNTPGGHTFQQHASNTTTLQKINAGNWDYVVLQAQSQEPSFSPNQVQQQTIPFALELYDQIKTANPCAEVVFYMTWGRKFGDTQNCAVYPPICTYEGMTNRLRESYTLMADLTESITAPVGICWKNARQINDAPELFNPDNSHPSLAGSYLGACTFFASIFKESPIGLSFNGGLPANDADLLKNIASTTVLDSLEEWRIGVYDPKADFEFNINGFDVSFDENASHASNYAWDLGDGNTSTEASLNHTYAAEGAYEVTLIVDNACKSDTLTQIVNIELPTQIKHAQNNNHTLTSYPNPVNAGEIIHYSGSLIRILDVSGREYQGAQHEGLNYLSIPSSGIYVLQFEGNINARIIVQ